MSTLFQHPNIIIATMFALSDVARDIYIVQSDFAAIFNN